jgi:HEPN domain-containing protein
MITEQGRMQKVVGAGRENLESAERNKQAAEEALKSARKIVSFVRQAIGHG